MPISPAFANAISIIARVGQGTQYAFRGTTSLVLQGDAMGLQDIDLLADRGAAENLDRGLADFTVSPLKYSQTSQHKSYFGQYKIGEVQVEIMGEWQIKSKGDWSEIFNANLSQITHVNSLPVTTVQTELKCYALLRRWSAYHKLKRQLV